MTTFKKQKASFLIIFFSLMFYNSQGQDLTNNAKLWFGSNLNYKIDKKFKAKLSALYAQNASPSEFSFMQFNLGLSYKLKRRMYIEFGYNKLLLNDTQRRRDLYDITPGLFNKLEFDRVYLSYSYKHDIVKRLSFKHDLEYQNFLPAVQKHKTRYVYDGKLQYNIRKSSIAPFIKNQLAYYAGGDLSNGIKRHRLITGASFKPIKDFSMSTTIYYLIQNEFNTELLSENDYTTFGINLNFNLN